MPKQITERIIDYPFTQFRHSAGTTIRAARPVDTPGTAALNLPWFDVTQYGVVGNGSNEATAIQAVLNAACAVGGTILFPGNGRVYGLGAGLQVTAPVSVWIMQGATLKFVAQPANTHTSSIGGLSTAMASILYGDYIDNWEVINDGLIDGDSHHHRFNSDGFRNVTGVVVYGGTGAYVSLGRVRRVATGIFLINCRRAVVENGSGQGYLCPSVVGAEGISDCFFTNLRCEQTHELLDFNADCDHNTVTNCVAKDVIDEALDINRSSHNLFRNIYIYGDPEAMNNYQGVWAVGQLYYGLRDEVGDVVKHNGIYYRYQGNQSHYDTGVLSSLATEPGTEGGQIWWVRWGCDGILVQGSAGVRFSDKNGTGADFNQFDGIDGYITRYAVDAFITVQAGYTYSTVPVTSSEFSCRNNAFSNVNCLGAGLGIFVNLGAGVNVESDKNYRGVWATGLYYAGKMFGGGDIVKKGTLYHRCIYDNLSAAGNAPDVAGGDDYWNLIEEGTVAFSDVAAGVEILDCHFENITAEAVRFNGKSSFPSSRITIDNLTVMGGSLTPVVYLENMHLVNLTGIKMPGIGQATAGIELYNVDDANLSHFYIAAADEPSADGNYGIAVGGASHRILMHSGILRNFTGPSTRGAIALVSDSVDDITTVRIANIIFQGNRYVVWDDTLSKGGDSFIYDCTLLDNLSSIRTPSLYHLSYLSNDPSTWSISAGGVATLTNKTYDDPIVTGHVVHTASGAFIGHTIVRNLADAFNVMRLHQDHASGSGAALELSQDGTGPLIRGYVGGAERFTVDSAGNVGIGTAAGAALAALHVVDGTLAAVLERAYAGTTALRTAARLRLTSSGSAADGLGPGLSFDLRDLETPATNVIGFLGFVRDGADDSGAFVMQAAAAGTLTERLRVTAAGAVGIGKIVPDARLHVVDATLAAVLERAYAGTTGLRGVAYLRLVSNGSAADGFGPSLAFEMHDAEMTTLNVIGQMGVVRNGADNTGKLQVQVATAGALALALELTNTGVLQPVGGIAFGAETLNTYDEGTWTPVITAATPGTMSITYTAQDGRYTRIGNVVFYTFRIQVNAFTAGTGTGDLRISLPVACPSGNANTYRHVVSTSGYDWTGTPIGVFFSPTAGQSYGTLAATTDNAGISVQPITGLAAGDVIAASGAYMSN